jgi:hypothetical protein
MKIFSMSLLLGLSLLTATAFAAKPELTPECRQKLVKNSLTSFQKIKAIRESVSGAASEINPRAATGQLFLFLMVGTSIHDRCNVLESGLARLRRHEEPSSRETKYLVRLCEADGDVHSVLLP